MKLKFSIKNIPKEVDVSFWSMMKIYLAVSITASLIFLVIWLIIFASFGWFK